MLEVVAGIHLPASRRRVVNCLDPPTCGLLLHGDSEHGPYAAVGIVHPDGSEV